MCHEKHILIYSRFQLTESDGFNRWGYAPHSSTFILVAPGPFLNILALLLNFQKRLFSYHDVIFQ